MEWLVHAMLSNALAVTVLALLVAMLGRASRRPALIHGLWLVVMLKLVTPPFVPISLPVAVNLAPARWTQVELQESRLPSIDLTEPWQDLAEAATDEKGLADRASEEGLEMPAALPPDGPTELGDEGWKGNSIRDANDGISLPAGWSWEHPVLALILSGAVAWWVLAAVRIVRFQRLMKDIDLAPAEWQARTHELAVRLGLSEAPSLCLVPGRVPPMLWAIGGRPRLLIPSELWSATTLDERTSLLLHELAHLKRRDHWVRWLELIVAGLYWWHPAVWWIRRLLREAEEQCCDAWVIWAMPRGAKTYASALLSAIEFVSGARTAPAASSATSGNGHVSCLKRRLRMIVRAQTPKGLSWAGRLAVLGTAVLLLPLAPSWGQKSNPDQAPVELDRAAVQKSLEQRLRSIEEEAQKKVDADAAREIRFPLRPVDAQLEQRIEKEFLKNPEVIAVQDKMATVADQLDQAKAYGHKFARQAAELEHTRLFDQYCQLWKDRYPELAKLHSQDDDKKDSKKDEGVRDDKSRETAERFEEHVKGLIDTLAKELGPVGDELRKVLEKSVDEIHQTLKKEGLSTDDLRNALEKSHDEMRKAFDKGGAINKELREAWEKSRDDLRAEWDRAQNDLRTAMRDRLESSRQQERLRERQAGRDQATDSPDKDAVEKDQDRAEIDKVHAEVRALQQQLRQANRRLLELQRRGMQRNARGRRSEGPLAKPAPDADPDAQPTPRASDSPSPRSSRSPGASATPETPRRVRPPADRQPIRPVRPPGDVPGPRGPGGGPPQYDERLRDLNDKLERLLKEVEELKGEKKSKDSKESSERSTGQVRTGAVVAF